MGATAARRAASPADSSLWWGGRDRLLPYSPGRTGDAAKPPPEVVTPWATSRSPAP